MKSIRQTILSIKIEYHFKRVKTLGRRIKKTSTENERLFSAINYHRYMAEKAIVEYEIAEGLRNSHGIWTGLHPQH